jgi:hypothetical protein
MDTGWVYFKFTCNCLRHLRHGYLVTSAILVGFRAPELEHDPPPNVFDVGHVERDQLGAPESPGVSLLPMGLPVRFRL